MKELVAQYVGKTGTSFLGGLVVRVNILDVKEAWGRQRFLISPVEGKGQVWVEGVNVEN